MRKAVFIDRDGTLIKDIPYNSNPELISFENHAIEFLKLLKRKDYLLIVVTNQGGVAQGYFTEEAVYNMHEAIKRMLRPYHVQVDAFYYCPHVYNGKIKQYAVECNCRKPKPGLILNAAKAFDISLENSWMVGDILHDVEAGNSAGCKTILINNGNETEWLLNKEREPAYHAKHLKEAANIIINYELESV